MGQRTVWINDALEKQLEALAADNKSSVSNLVNLGVLYVLLDAQYVSPDMKDKLSRIKLFLNGNGGGK